MLEANLYISKAHASVSTGRKPVLLFILFVFKSTKFSCLFFMLINFILRLLFNVHFVIESRAGLDVLVGQIQPVGHQLMLTALGSGTVGQ